LFSGQIVKESQATTVNKPGLSVLKVITLVQEGDKLKPVPV